MSATTIFEHETCSRCGGTGKYSFNLMDGDTCYGCNGTGWKLTKRGAAAQALYKSLVTRTIDQLKIADIVWYRFMASGCWMVVEDINLEKKEVSLSVKDEKYGVIGQIEFRILPTHEQNEIYKKQALDYQATLTKSGTVKKGAK